MTFLWNLGVGDRKVSRNMGALNISIELESSVARAEKQRSRVPAAFQSLWSLSQFSRETRLGKEG